MNRQQRRKLGQRGSARRIRTGISEFDDGWHIVVEMDGKPQVYDPPFATEEEAEAAATELGKAIRMELVKRKVPYVPNPNPENQDWRPGEN